MATLVRRIWSALRDEAILCAGNLSYPNYSSRAEHALYQAYLDLCLTYHFHEFETSSTVTLVANATNFALPADCFIVTALTWSTAATVAGQGLARQLREEPLAGLIAKRSQKAGRWGSYARWGSNIELDCPLDTNATAGATLALHYYQRPAAPDYTLSTSPTTAWEWDDHLIDAAVAKLQARNWVWDQQGMTLQTLKDWLARQVQPALTDEPMTNPPDMTRASRPQGGTSQG